MVFNTGAALLDAIVLSVVSKDVEGTYGYRITQDVREVIDISPCTRFCVDCRKRNVWRFTTWPLTGETADIIRSQKKAWHS